MTSEGKSRAAGNQAPELPEPIRVLFQTAFDASKLAPGDIAGSPQAYDDAMQKALPLVVQRQQEAAARARKVFLQLDHDGTAQEVFARMDRLAASGDFFESEELCPEAAFAVLLDRAASVDERGQDEDAAAMYALLQVLRPDQPLPFINGFNIIWKHAGPRLAAECYAMMAPLMEDPVFFYYAADCFESAGLKEDARQAIACALELLEDSGSDEGFAQEVRAYHEELHGSSKHFPLA